MGIDIKILFLEINFEILLRIIGAGICGFLIGFERKTRLKEAGLRTHTIVSIGSALFTIVSIYGFSGETYDGARVAAQIVTGIGFLGAGMIIFRRNSLYGLTTAAGIWTVAGIGMAMGVGMYALGLFTTLFIFIIQFIFHSNFKVFTMKKTTMLVIECEAENYAIAKIEKIFNIENVYRTKIIKNSDETYSLYLTIKTFNEFSVEKLLKITKENSFIKKIDNSED